MNSLLKPISLVALGLVTVPSVLHFTGTMNHDAVLNTALIGTILWFATTPWWMGRDAPVDADQVEI